MSEKTFSRWPECKGQVACDCGLGIASGRNDRANRGYRTFFTSPILGGAGSLIRKNVTLAAVFAIGFALSLVLYWTLRSVEDARVTATFDDYATQRFAALEQSLRLTRQSLEALASFYEAVPDVDRASFGRFASPLLRADNTIQALEWAPYVAANRRADFERGARDDGYPEFKFTERSSASTMHAAGDRNSYFPVYYVEPLVGNEPALGFDLASDPARRQALETAIDTGEATATEPIVLVQESGNQHGFLLFLPVYASASSPTTVEERRAALRGLVLGVFRVGDIVKRSAVSSSESNSFIDLAIYDESAPARDQLLYPAQPSAEFEGPPRGSLKASRTLSVGGHTWRVIAVPRAQFIHAEQLFFAPLAFAGALLFTFISGLYCWQTLRQRERAKRAENLLRDAVESICEGFVIYDPDDRLLVCNEGYRRLYARSASFMVQGAHFEDILRQGVACGEYADAVGREEDWLGDRMRLHRLDQSTVEQPLADGRWLLVSERRTSMGGKAGLRVDITALKSVQAELQESRAAVLSEAARSAEIARNLTHVQRIAGIGSMQKDYRTGRLEWSDEVYRILGLEPGTPPDYELFRRLVHSDDRALFDRAVENAKRNLPGLPFEYRIIRPDGEVRTVHREAEVLCDADGQILRRVTTMMDVTELRRTERELRANQEMLAWAQRTLGIGSIAINLATHEVKRSELWDSIHGFSNDPPTSGDMLEQVRRQVHPEDLEAWEAHVANVSTTSRSEPFEFRYIRPDDGREVWLCEHSDTLRDANQPVAQITTIQDVTQRQLDVTKRRELEKQLFHSQKLEALGTLAGGIAHDLNNSLVPILMLGQFSLQIAAENDPLRDNLAQIVAAGEHARDLVKRILAFSRKQELSKGPIDLAAVVRNTVRMLQPTVPTTIHLESDIADVPLIIGDSGQLQQVIVNLINNSVHAIGDRPGRISLALKIMPATGAAGAQKIVVSISDTGCGMDEITLARIFEPFFTTKAVGEGTGLGLAMVHGIIEGHGGRITVKSTLGVGTTFIVALPLNAEDVATGIEVAA